MAEKIIGRNDQIEELRSYASSDHSEFIAVYGRRRVGKTFLVRHAFNFKFSFSVSGIYKANKREQLTNFILQLRKYSQWESIPIPNSWVEAFSYLTRYLESLPVGPKVIFLDELPWLDTHKSGFINALENFWNEWATMRDDIKLIVCGSATSWITNKIIRSRGGLHNRVTHKMRVEPFRLKQCEEYFKAYGFDLSQMHIAEAYMVMGGIPYYLSLMNRSKSLAENIDQLFFVRDAKLDNEFNVLYNSLFKNPEPHIRIIEALAKKGIGYTRKELVEATRLTDNGNFSTMLEELELCGFIRSYLPFPDSSDRRNKGKRAKRNTLYQLIDFYTLFYFKFLKDKRNDSRFWSDNYHSPQVNTWRGISFEKLCLVHYPEVKTALGINGVHSSVYSWTKNDKSPGTQIDMLIDRMDSTINLCEIKYSDSTYKLDKNTFDNLQNKILVFKEETGTRKSIIVTMITTNGVALNRYSEIIQRQVVLSQLFS